MRSCAFVGVPDGFLVCGLMTTRSNCPVPTAVVFGISGGAGSTTVAVPLAALARAGRGGWPFPPFAGQVDNERVVPAV